jgi:hypothetical protein
MRFAKGRPGALELPKESGKGVAPKHDVVTKVNIQVSCFE